MSIPSKWCIKTTPENKDVINKWFNDGCKAPDNYKGSGNYMHYPSIKADHLFIAGEHNLSCVETCKGYEEITYDQFLQFIGKQEFVENYQIY